MDAQAIWQQCFKAWPEDMPRRGVVVTFFNEQIPFQSFMASESMVLFERSAPDALGARMVMIPYGGVQALKIVDVSKPKAFAAMGFEAAPSKKQPAAEK